MIFDLETKRGRLFFILAFPITIVVFMLTGLFAVIMMPIDFIMYGESKTFQWWMKFFNIEPNGLDPF